MDYIEIVHREGFTKGGDNGMHKADLAWAADSFGEVVRRAREAKGLTQKQLAKRCDDLSPMYISQIENKQRVPRLRICRLLAKALDLDERRLLLLAYRTTAPEEIKGLLAREEAAPYGDRIPSRFKNLLQIVSNLPKDKKDQVAKFWEEAVRLVVSTAR